MFMGPGLGVPGLGVYGLVRSRAGCLWTGEAQDWVFMDW